MFLMMSAKIATPGLPKVETSWKEGYDVKISVHDASNKALSSDSSYIADVVN